MNPEKLKKLQEQVRIGGKGTPRRKKKVVHSTPATDDKKLQSSLKKLSVNTIPGIEEVIHFIFVKSRLRFTRTSICCVWMVFFELRLIHLIVTKIHTYDASIG